MASAPAEYPLARSFISSVRLNVQHYNSKQAQGFLIHPDVKFDTPNPVIADIGTGTGIWLLDLSETMSEATQFVGFDIDLSQTPPKEWLPKNVTMKQLDVYDDLPDDLVGRFDLVHVKAFICVIQDGTPQPVLSKLIRMLKPGGYIQWTEMDFDTMAINSVVPTSSVPGAEKLFKFGKSPNPKWPESAQKWPKDLKHLFTESGLENVIEHRFKRRPWQRPFYYNVTLLAFSEMSAKAPDPAAAQSNVDQAAHEYQTNRNGVDIDFTTITAVGKKGLGGGHTVS